MADFDFIAISNEHIYADIFLEGHIIFNNLWAFLVYLLGTTLSKPHKPDLFDKAIALSYMHQIATEFLIASQFQA